MVHLVLDDGRVLKRKTTAMAGAYHLIATAIDESFPQFKKWLEDMSNRPVPFMDFDLRGLAPEYRAEFHRATRAIRDQLASSGKYSELDIEAFDTLVRMKEAIDRGEPPLSMSDDDEVEEFSEVFIVDINQVWDA